MTVKDLLDIERDDFSIDVCDDYDERCDIAYDNGFRLTDAGRERFAAALGIPVEMYFYPNGWNNAVLHCETGKQAQACQELFYAIAGYCSDSDFDVWFEER